MFTNQINEIERIIHSNADVPVIVEGKKDRQALQKLGFSKIIEISGKAIDRVVEGILSEKPKSVIILTDYDRDGMKKANQLANFFQHHHVKVNSLVRRKVQVLFKIHKIEELSRFTKIIDFTNITGITTITNFTTSTNFTEYDNHGKTSSIHDKIFNRSRVYGRRHSREARRYRGHIRPD
jgi:5S rRNA maturation endonuclease (ribonuclease M5)